MDKQGGGCLVGGNKGTLEKQQEPLPWCPQTCDHRSQPLAASTTPVLFPAVEVAPPSPLCVSEFSFCFVQGFAQSFSFNLVCVYYLFSSTGSYLWYMALLCSYSSKKEPRSEAE